MEHNRDNSSFPLMSDGYAQPAHRAPAPKVEQFVGIIRGGMSAESDYTDARYYVERAVPRADPRAAEPMRAVVDSLPGAAQRVTATNLAELPLGSHLLSAGTAVRVSVLYPRAAPGGKVYVFDCEPPRAVVVQISAPAGGAGEYSGKILGGVSSASAGADLAMPAGMAPPDADNALILNLEEDRLSGHRLKNGSYTVGVIRGATGDVPPRPIVLIRGSLGRTDGPATLGGAVEGSEEAETDTWSRETDARPLDLYVVARVVYNESGDQALYSFVRKMSFDARGVLYEVGAETRVTVDVTEACG